MGAKMSKRWILGQKPISVLRSCLFAINDNHLEAHIIPRFKWLQFNPFNIKLPKYHEIDSEEIHKYRSKGSICPKKP